MSLRSRVAGTLLAAIGLVAVSIGPGSKPALALTGPCVWNEAKQDWDYPTEPGHSCANDSYSQGTQQGYVATRGAILENGKPVWAEYEPDRYTLVPDPNGASRLVFVPGVPKRIAVAEGEYEAAQVLAGDEVRFAVERYTDLSAPNRYAGKFELFRRSQVPTSFYDKHDNPTQKPPALNPRTLWVMVLKAAFTEPGTNPLLAEFPLDPRGVSDLGHTNYLVKTKDESDLGRVLYMTGGPFVADSSGNVQEGTISYLSAFFSELPNNSPARWGFCKDYNSGNYSTGEINSILTRDDVRAFADCDAHRIGSIWAPLGGAWVDSASARLLGGGIPTQANGGYQLSYMYLSGYTYWDTMYVTLNYQPLDVRSVLGSRWYIRKVVPAGATMEFDVGKYGAYSSQVGGLGISYGTSSANQKYTGQNDNPLMGAVSDGISTDTHKPRSVNFPVEVAYTNGWIQFANQQRPGVWLNASQNISIVGDVVGTLSSAPPEYSAAPASAPRSQVPIDLTTGRQAVGGAGGGPTIDRVQVSQADLELPPVGISPDGTTHPVYDDSLLQGLSRTDFANTDVHVFGPGGDLVTSRIGLRQNESPGLTCDTGQFSPNGTPICKVTEKNPAAFSPISDFIRNRYPGARYKVIVVNRSTGYMGTGFVRVGGDGQNGLQAYEVEGNAGPRSPILLRPPNLKVEVTRIPNYQRAGSDLPCQTYIPDEPCEQFIGFEGGGLSDDQQIVIRTEWRDWDGSPLPSDLPGFTARLSRVRSAGELGAVGQDEGVSGAGDLAHFPIQPNRHTQVLRVSDPNAYHYYLHVSGANDLRCGKATSTQASGLESSAWFGDDSPACASFAKEVDAQFDNATNVRPSRFVPIKVPVFDAAGTAQALDLRIQTARAQAAGNPQAQVVVQPVDPIYTFVYRPEAQFSVYDLKEFASPTVITKFDSGTNQTKTTLRFGYTLGTSEGLDPLSPFGSQKDPTWSLGFDELVAAVNRDNETAEWDDLEGLLRLSPAEQVAKLNGLVNELSPSTYLALQLYLANDRGNPLYQDFDIPYLLQMSAEPIVLTRRENLGGFATEATLPPVLEGYRPIPFVLLRDARVTVSAIDEGGTAYTLSHPPRVVPAGLHYFVLDGSKLTALALSQAFTLRFEASVPPDAAGTPVSQFPSHTVDIAVRRDVIRSNRALGEVVEHDVNILDGSLRLSRQDFSLPGLGPELSLQRMYSNLHGESEALNGAGEESDLGPGWSHTLNLQLVAAAIGQFGPGSVPDWVGSLSDPIAEPAVVEPHLHEDTTELSSVRVNGATFIRVNGAWVGERGRQAKLRQNPGCGPLAPKDCFEYVARDGTRYVYDFPRAVDSTGGTPPTLTPASVALGGLAESLGGYQGAATNAHSGALASGPPVVSVNYIEDRFGNVMVFNYDSDDGRLESVEDATHRKCKFDYRPSVLQDCDEPPSAAFKRLRSVTCLGDDGGGVVRNAFGDDISLTVNYCYDKDGNLAKVSRGKELERYQYKREGDLPGGNFNLWKFSDALASTRTFTYVPGHGAVQSGIDPAVHLRREDMVEKIEFPETVTIDGPVKPVVRFQYGPRECSPDDCVLDNTRTVTDPRGRGLQKLYRLNQRGNPSRIEEPKGKYTELVWSEDDPNAGCGDGAPANGHMLMKRTVNRGDKILVTQFGYDAEGNVTSECGPGGYTQTWFRPSGDPNSGFGLLESRTDFHQVREEWHYQPDNGFLLEHVTDAGRDGFTTQFDPHPTLKGRVLREKVKAAKGDRITVYAYDSHGNLASTKIENVAGSTVTVQHDARGRLELQYDRKLAVTKYHYDVNDHLELVELPEGVAKPDLVHVATKLHYTYDRAGNLESETDRNGLLLSYTYTQQNQVLTVKRAPDGEGEAIRQLAYDELGNVTSEQDWAGRFVTHTYDELGFRESTKDRTRKHEMISRHDLLGNVTSFTDFAGLETIYHYDDLNRELTATPNCLEFAPDCVTRTTAYELAQNLAGARYTMSVTDGGRTFYTGFDSRGLKVRTKDPIGGIYASNYDELGQLISTVDEAGFLTEFEYDGRGYATKSIARGVRHTLPPIITGLEPDDNGNTHVVRRWRTSGDENTLSVTSTTFDAWNRPTLRTFEGAGVLPLSETFVYDGAGNVVSHRDKGQRTRTWARDKRGHVRAYENAETADGGGYEKREYLNFDPNGNAHLVRDARKFETTIDYDEEERVTTVTEGSNALPNERRQMTVAERDGLGNPKRLVDFRGNEHIRAYTERHRLKSEKQPGKPAVLYTYTPTGQVSTLTNARGFTRTFTYDALDRVQNVYFPDLNTRESFTDYDAVGNVTIKENRRHSVTENIYDDFLRVHVVNRFRGSGPKTPVLTQEYDDLGNPISTTDANGVTVEFRYNNRNQLVTRVYEPVDGEPEEWRSEVRDYYDNGTLKSVTPPHEPTEEAFATTYEYDNEDRLISQFVAGASHLAAGERTTFAYDDNGNLRKLTKPEGQPGGRFEGKSRSFAYDALNRLERVTDEVGLKTKYIYDPASNLRHVYGPYLGDAWEAAPHVEYLYDDLVDRVVERDQYSAFQATSVTSFDEYDANDNVTALRDPLRRAFRYRYDHYDRLIHSDYQDDPATPYYRPQNVDIKINDDTNVTRIDEEKIDPDGNLVTDSTVEERDLVFDRLMRSTQRGVEVAYDYFANGNRRSVGSPSGVTTYTYDQRNRPDQTFINSAPTTYRYHQDGRLDRVDLGNGTVTRYDYSSTQRVEGITHEFHDGFRAFHYQYDKNGNPLTADDETSEGHDPTTFEYDAADRITGFTQSGRTTRYTYERYNRRTEVVPGLVDKTYDYDPLSERLKTVTDAIAHTTTTYETDSNGNVYSRAIAPSQDTTTFAFDIQNKLKQATHKPPGLPPVVLGQYDYDSAGRRVRQDRTERGSVASTYDGISVLEESLSTVPGPIHSHYGGDLLAQSSLGVDSYVHQDSLGSTANVTDAGASSTAELKYDPFGGVRSPQAAQSGATFTGQQHDAATGLYYYGARFYDPTLGRFLSEDTWEGTRTRPESLEKFLYAYSNPAKFTDPTGHEPTAQKKLERERSQARAREAERNIHAWEVCRKNGDCGTPKNNADDPLLKQPTDTDAEWSRKQHERLEGPPVPAARKSTREEVAKQRSFDGNDLARIYGDGSGAGAVQTREDASGATPVDNNLKGLWDRRGKGSLKAFWDSFAQMPGELTRSTSKVHFGLLMPPGFSSLMEWEADQWDRLKFGKPLEEDQLYGYNEAKFGTDIFAFGITVVSGEFIASGIGKASAAAGRLWEGLELGLGRIPIPVPGLGSGGLGFGWIPRAAKAVPKAGEVAVVGEVEVAAERIVAEAASAAEGGFASRQAAFKEMGQFRKQLGEIPARTGPDDGVLARLDIEGQQPIYGVNAHGQRTSITKHRFSRTHAEADAFEQASRLEGVAGKRARLYVDAPTRLGDEVCFNCGYEVVNMAQRLGLVELEVHTPTSISLLRLGK